MSKTARRVLVTGGAGFLGSELVRQCLGRGLRVVVVDDLSTGKRRNLEGLPPGDCRLVVADVRGTARMARLLRGVDLVYHLACLGVRHSIHSPEENHDVNATGALRLLKAARAAKVRRFVHVSTSEVYGTGLSRLMDERHPTSPCTVYGASKLAGECYARAFHRTYGYPVTVVRPFNAYGPRSHHEGDSGEVIPKMMLRCLAGRSLVVFGDGLQTRDFTFCEDTARGILLAGFSDRAVGETVNIGSGRETPILSLTRLIARACGRPGCRVAFDPPRPGDVRRLCADTGRARRLLGFRPRVGLEEGLGRLRAWYLEQRQKPEVLLAREVRRNWRAAGRGGGS